MADRDSIKVQSVISDVTGTFGSVLFYVADFVKTLRTYVNVVIFFSGFWIFNGFKIYIYVCRNKFNENFLSGTQNFKQTYHYATSNLSQYRYKSDILRSKNTYIFRKHK